MDKRFVLGIVLLTAAFLLVSCGGAGKAAEPPVATAEEINLSQDQAQPAQTDTDSTNQTDETAVQQGTETSQPEPMFVKKPRFEPKTAYEKSFEYAKDNVIYFGFGSGLGTQYTLDDKASAEILSILDVDGAPWKNLYLIERPYHSGSPKLTAAKLDSVDFSGWRWDDTGFDRSTAVEDISQSIIAEVTLAQALSGTGKDEDRYAALMVSHAAAKQAAFMAYNGKANEGMYGDIGADGSVIKDAANLKEQFLMLHAFSLLSDYAKSKTNYAGIMKSTSAGGYANQVFNVIAVKANKDGDSFYDALDPADYAVAIRSLAVYIGVTNKPKWQQMAEEMIVKFADKLREKLDATGALAAGKYDPLLTQAAGIVALSDANTVTQTPDYADDARRMFKKMQESWDDKQFAYKNGNAYVLTVQDLSMVVQAYNLGIHQLELREEDNFAAFLRNAVVSAKFQQAEPQSSDEDIPTADASQTAPVLGSKVAYDPATQQWQMQDSTFVTGDAMAAAVSLMDIGMINGVEAVPYNGIPQGLSISS